jgi:hypothetical protein
MAGEWDIAKRCTDAAEAATHRSAHPAPDRVIHRGSVIAQVLILLILGCVERHATRTGLR